MRTLLFIIFTCFTATLCQIDPGPWTEILKNIMIGNQVNYTILITNENLNKSFTSFLSALADDPPGTDECKNGTANFIAKYINAYNALSVNMVITNPCRSDPFGECAGPIKSIRDISSMTKKVWNKPAGTVCQKSVTLNDIENILRQQTFLIHGAIVCSSVGCPDLNPEAYRPGALQFNLEQQMRQFLQNNTKGSKLDTSSKTLYLSAIFVDFFPSDFGVNSTGIINTLKPYLPDDTVKWIAANGYPSVKAFDYDWDLNGFLADTGCPTRTCFPGWALIVVVVVGIIFLVLLVILIVFFVSRRRRSGYQTLE